MCEKHYNNVFVFSLPKHAVNKQEQNMPLPLLVYRFLGIISCTGHHQHKRQFLVSCRIGHSIGRRSIFYPQEKRDHPKTHTQATRTSVTRPIPHISKCYIMLQVTCTLEFSTQVIARKHTNNQDCYIKEKNMVFILN